MGEWELAEVECEKAIQAGCPLWDLNGVDMTDNGSESTGNLKQQYMISATSPEVLFTQGMNVMNLLMYDGTNVGRFKASVVFEIQWRGNNGFTYDRIFLRVSKEIGLLFQSQDVRVGKGYKGF